ncbi:hypothetical protein EBS40_02715 [bacterium]|nr:hypothetical protein [bacterium]
MSKDIDNIIKNVLANNKEIHNMENHISRDMNDLKRSIKHINTQIQSINDKIEQILEIMNTFTIMLEEEENSEDYEGEENSEWTPYDDVSYEPENEDEDEENL